MAPAAADRLISLGECKLHHTEKSCWIVVHGGVYDVTDFLEEHPGGYDIILTVTGKDATQDFDEIGHSNSAKALLQKYLIGKFESGDSAPAREKVQTATSVPAKTSALARAFSVILPLLLLLIAISLNMYGKK